MLNLWIGPRYVCVSWKTRKRKFFKHFPAICYFGRRELWYTTTWIEIGKFQYWMFPFNYFIPALLCLSLKPPVQLPWSCFFTLSFAIVPSYFYLSPITVRTELSRHDKNSNREHPGEKLGLTWRLFLSLDKFYIPAYRYLFISFIPWPSDRKNGSFRCGY